MPCAGRDFFDACQACGHRTAITTPRDHRLVGFQSDGECIARLHGDHSGEAVGHARLSIGVVTPCDHRAIGPQCQRVIVSCGNSCEWTECGREILLSEAEPSKAHHRAIGLQCDGVLGACVDGHHIGESSGNVGHAIVVAIAPGDDRTIGFHRHGMTRSRGDRDDPLEASRHLRLE